MSDVSRIEWTFYTDASEGSGTDDQVTVRILRDGHQLVYANVEPGETARLDRGTVQSYSWTFKNPSGICVSVSGQTVRYTEQFPQGVHGHLVCQLEILGGDLWRFDRINSRVISGRMVGVPGTIDSWTWVESAQVFDFVPSAPMAMSTVSSEGFQRVNLHY